MPQMVDMQKTEKEEENLPLIHDDQYPCGLCITLTQEELDKLGLDASCAIGDMIHIFAMAKVTSKSMSASKDYEHCCVTLQITHMGLEDESNEGDEAYMEPAESEEPLDNPRKDPGADVRAASDGKRGRGIDYQPQVPLSYGRS